MNINSNNNRNNSNNSYNNNFSIENIIENIGIEEYINALLVDNDIRSGMMIQPADYNERTTNNRISSLIVSEIKKYFPSLKSSVINQGVILSKNEYSNNYTPNSKKLGNILGYPCANNFNNIIDNSNKESITYSLIVMIKKSMVNKYNIGSRYFLLANRCKNKSKIEEMKNISEKANELIQKNKFLKKFVERFEVEESITIPIKNIIDKLLKKQKLNENEIGEMLNQIWNLGFEELPMYEFNYKNSLHRGILLTLMTYAQNTPLEPFFPLQNYPEKDDMVNEITQKWEKELIRVLDKAK
jgi:hypothetical protein